MENRKRPRLEAAPTIVGSSGSSGSRTVVSSDIIDCSSASIPIATIEGQSFFLSNAPATTATNGFNINGFASSFPQNLYLTICEDGVEGNGVLGVDDDYDDDDIDDDMSRIVKCNNSGDEESQEFLAIDDGTLVHIKQEQELINGVQQAQTAAALRTTTTTASPTATTLPLQYNLINSRRQLQKADNSTAMPASTARILPSSVQLPSGCEIYLVKEYLEPTAAVASTSHLNIGTSTVQRCDNNTLTKLTPTATIKIEPDCIASSSTNAAADTAAVGNVGINICNINNNNNNSSNNNNNNKKAAATTTTTAVNSVAVSVEGDTNGKRSFILETYKKRDDKRRATHNEVERRRRDKINSWIFKLKEMLPTTDNNNKTSITPSPSPSSSSSITATTTTAKTVMPTSSTTLTDGNSANDEQTTEQQQQPSRTIHNSRTPQNDSKSQILIKACEYIKAMQEEVKSLRECLTENENLRLCNQRLQSELNQLKSEKQQQQQPLYTSNGNRNRNNGINSSSISGSSSSSSSIIGNRNFHLTLNSLNNLNSCSNHDSNQLNDDLFGTTTTTTTTTNAEAAAAAAATNALIDATILSNNNNNHNSNNNSHNNIAALFTKRELIITDYVD